MQCLCVIMDTTLQLHVIFTITGSFSPNSRVGVYVLANENRTEYTAITIKAGGKYKVSCGHAYVRYPMHMYKITDTGSCCLVLDDHISHAHMCAYTNVHTYKHNHMHAHTTDMSTVMHNTCILCYDSS